MIWFLASQSSIFTWRHDDHVGSRGYVVARKLSSRCTNISCYVLDHTWQPRILCTPFDCYRFDKYQVKCNIVFNASMTVCFLFAIHRATNYSEYYITSPINRRRLTNYKARSISVVLSQHWESLLRTEINDSEFGTLIFHLNLRPISTDSNDVLSLKNTIQRITTR